MLTRLLRQVFKGSARDASPGAQTEARRLEALALGVGSRGDLDLARRYAQQALECDPQSVVARFCLGNILYREEKLDDSIEVYREALRIQPDHASVHYNLGLALQTRGDTAEAIAHYRSALQLVPDLPDEHGTLLFLLNADYASDPLEVSAEHLSWGRRFADGLARPVAYANTKEPERRLRVGYVSGDFSGHAASSFIAPLLSHHDRERYEVHGFANADTLPAEDAFPGTRWHRIAGIADEQASRLIAEQGIDILVDLSGHTNHNRLLLFARKPAPLQMTVLGYPNTTGLAAMDYRITDVHGDPPGMTEHYYRERLLRLPRSLWCYSPSALVPLPAPAPFLASGQVTFASLAAAYKLSDPVLQAWIAILQAVPESRLVVATIPGGEAQERIRRRLGEAGIAPGRIEIVARQPVLEYWKVVGSVDLALDSFPCNGGATTCESLWLGVPTLTLSGSTFRERAGLSLLTNIGLQELIAHSVGEYVEKAVALGRAPERIVQLRQGLRERMARSPVMDARGYARDFEALYRLAWREWCAGGGQSGPTGAQC
jgi:predicted O-linked N-acetylglucosamine transferase (SPINDLY family)